MSRSSSTIRMSSAIMRSPLVGIGLDLNVSFGGRLTVTLGGATRVAGKAHCDNGSAPGRGGERHLAAVLLDDLVDDRQAQAGALVARGHVRFEDAVALS